MSWGVCPLEGVNVKIPRGAQVEGNRPALETGSGQYFYQPDAHLTIVDLARGLEYDLWQVHRSPINPEDGTELRFSWGGIARLDGNGVAQAGNATAAHFASLAGRIRIEELQAGQINHALFIVVNCDNGQYVFPATGKGRACSHPSVNLPDAYAPPMGARFWLDMSAAEIDALPIQTWKKTILHAFASYGAFFGDTGTSGLFAIETEAGNQYTSIGSANPWYDFGRSNWEQYQDQFVGKLYATSADAQQIDWMTTIWSRLKVVDPCVSAGTCH
jgi:hypothetical protein